MNELTVREFFIIQDYINEMINLYDNTMVMNNEPLYLSEKHIPVYRDELLRLKKKLNLSSYNA
ncbi:hypothetical protein lbkm_0430 [Lachnospiraceae bacterium KM106-2]|nr:hypothetical protein lbkm_0430 [Lachnospiraceae bacterium KM106-2]